MKNTLKYASVKKAPRGKPFTSANKGKPKGSKAVKTLVKEQLGVDSWQRLCDYVTNEGAIKYIESLENLNMKDYIVAFNAILEYIKPKLIRSDNRNINVNINESDITFK